jgi:hypothetical protein
MTPTTPIPLTFPRAEMPEVEASDETSSALASAISATASASCGDGWIFVGAFCKRRWLLAADEMNFARFANIHPKARNVWKCRSARIRGQAEHPLVKIEVSREPGLIAVNAYSAVSSCQ